MNQLNDIFAPLSKNFQSFKRESVRKCGWNEHQHKNPGTNSNRNQYEIYLYVFEIRYNNLMHNLFKHRTFMSDFIWNTLYHVWFIKGYNRTWASLWHILKIRNDLISDIRGMDLKLASTKSYLLATRLSMFMSARPSNVLELITLSRGIHKNLATLRSKREWASALPIAVNQRLRGMVWGH